MKMKKMLGIVLSLATVMSTIVVPASVKAADTIIFSENFETSATYTVSGHTLNKVGGVDVISGGTTGWVRANSDGSNTAMLLEPGNVTGDSVAKIRIPVTIPIDDGDYEYSFKFKAERHSGYIMSLGNLGTGVVGSEKKMNFAGTNGDTLYYYYENTNSYTGFTSCSGSVPRDYTTIKYILHTDTKTFDMYVGATQVASGATWYYAENKTNGIEWIDFYTSYTAGKNGTDASTDTYSKYWVDDILVKKIDPNAVAPDPEPEPVETEFVQTFDDLAIGATPVTVTDMANADDSVVNVQDSPVSGAGKALKAVIGVNNTTVKVNFGNLSLTNGKKYKISYKMYPESYTSRAASHMPYIYSGSTNVAGGQISGTTLHPIWTTGVGSVDLSTWATQHPNEYITVDYVVTLGSTDNGTMTINGEKYTGYVWANVSSISSIDFNFAAASGNTVIWFDDISVTEYVGSTSYSEDFEGMEIGDAWIDATEGSGGDGTNSATVVSHNGNKVLEVKMPSSASYKVKFDFSDLALEDGKEYKVSYKLYPKNPGTRGINQTYLYNKSDAGFAGGYTTNDSLGNLMLAPLYYTGTGFPTVNLTGWAASKPDEYITIEYILNEGAASGSSYACIVNGTKYTVPAGGNGTWGATEIGSFGFQWGGNDSVDPSNPEIYYIDDVKVRQAADIDDIILTDASDNEISSLTGLTSVKAAVTLTAPIDSYVIIAAVVDGDGNLKAVTPHTATASATENMTVNIPAGANDNWNIKFMIWDGFTNIKPLVEPVMRPKNMVNLYVDPFV